MNSIKTNCLKKKIQTNCQGWPRHAKVWRLVKKKKFVRAYQIHSIIFDKSAQILFGTNQKKILDEEVNMLFKRKDITTGLIAATWLGVIISTYQLPVALTLLPREPSCASLATKSLQAVFYLSIFIFVTCHTSAHILIAQSNWTPPQSLRKPCLLVFWFHYYLYNSTLFLLMLSWRFVIHSSPRRQV